VRWLQGLDAYVDLRQPASLPDFPHAVSLNDLSMRDCASLATQEGFADRLSFDGRHFEWARRIDFQPKSSIADAGSLEWDAGVLVERGRDIGYIEHWHRDAAAATVPYGAAVLREAGSGTNAVLLRVGGAFMFARHRSRMGYHRKRGRRRCANGIPGMLNALFLEFRSPPTVRISARAARPNSIRHVASLHIAK
jgi:hypothetical protein